MVAPVPCAVLLEPLVLALPTELALDPSVKVLIVLLTDGGNMVLTLVWCKRWKYSQEVNPQSKLGGGLSESHEKAPTICCRSTASRAALPPLELVAPVTLLVSMLRLVASRTSPPLTLPLALLLGVGGASEPAVMPEAALKPRRMLPEEPWKVLPAAEGVPGVPGVVPNPALPGKCTYTSITTKGNSSFTRGTSIHKRKDTV